MDEQLLKKLLSTLSKEAFSTFVFEMWKLEDISTDYDYRKTKSIKYEMYEQHYWGKDGHKGVPDYQGYNLIIPFFQPIELFSNVEENSLINSELINQLKYYNRRITDRGSSWQFWTDGQYNMPRISFVTNFEGIEERFLIEKIFPKFKYIVEHLNITAETAVGSCDTFIHMNPDNTIKAFKKFIEKNQKQISISFSKGKFQCDYILQDKYLSSGILKNSKHPYEPVYIENSIDKSEIIKEFEFLINIDSSEATLEKFLKENYKTIFGEQYDRIETQLWLKFPELDISNKNRRLDVFLRNSVERDWELYELKNTKKLTRTYRDIPTFTSEIHNSIQQIRTYEKLLAQEKVKTKFAREGIEYYYPEIKIVIGNRPDISDEQWRFLKSTNEHNLKIITFDELLTSMKARYNLKNNTNF